MNSPGWRAPPLPTPFRSRSSRPARGGYTSLWFAACLGALVLAAPPAWAQEDARDPPAQERGGDSDRPRGEEAEPGLPPGETDIDEAVLVTTPIPEKEKRKYPDVDVRGEVEVEYVETQNETSSPAGQTDRSTGYYQLDFVGLDVRVRVARKTLGRLEARFSPDEVVDVQQGYFHLGGLPLDGFVRLGLTQRLIKPRRKTETYPLAGTAFWKGQDVGLTGGIDWRFLQVPGHGDDAGDDLSLSLVAEGSLTNGVPVGDRRIGEDRSFRIIGYEEQNWDENSSKLIGYNAGLKGKIADLIRFDLMTFGYASRLTDDDLAFLSGISGYGTGSSRVNTFFGASGRLRAAGLTLFTQLCNGRVGLLGRAAWYVQASYKVEWGGFSLGGRKILRSVEPLVRYGVLDIDIPHDPADPFTWNRDRLTVALLLEVFKELELKIEYTINGETTGGSEVGNDEFLFQMQFQF